MSKASVFKLFNMLDNQECEKQDIIKFLQISSPAFYKNIHKMKLAGFEVNNKKGIYYLKRYKSVLKLDEAEKSVIAYMLNIALEYLPKYKYDNFKNFVKKFLMLANEVDYDEVKRKFRLIKQYSLVEKYEEKIDTLESYILKKQKIKVTLSSQRKMIIKPLYFDWKKDKVFLYYMNIAKDIEERINIDFIVKIEENFERDYIIENQEIIFELYGVLAKRYLLKENERIIKSTKDSIVIASNPENQEMLFKRLLRYDTLCKILFPKSEAQAFNNLIDKAIMNMDSLG